MRARSRLQAGGRRALSRPVEHGGCACHIAQIPDRAGIESATPSWRPSQLRGAGRSATASAGALFGGQHLPVIRSDRPQLRRPRPAGRFIIAPTAGEWGEVAVERGRAGAALSPPPPRLCAADALPGRGFRLACPNCDAWGCRRTASSGRLVCHICGLLDPPPPGESRTVRHPESFVAVRSRASSGWSSRRPAVSRDRRILVLCDRSRRIESFRSFTRGNWAGRPPPAASTSSSADQLVPRATIFPTHLSGVHRRRSRPSSNGDPRPPSAPFNCCIR